jgi:hypothetical protein
MSNGYGPMCDPIYHEGREYWLTSLWSSWANWIEISGDSHAEGWAFGPAGAPGEANVVLPLEAALKVAAAILRYDRLPNEPDRAAREVFNAILDGILSHDTSAPQCTASATDDLRVDDWRASLAGKYAPVALPGWQP